MRATTSQTLTLCVGLTTILFLTSAFQFKESAELPPPDFDPEIWAAEHYSTPVDLSDSVNTIKKKRYDIIFDNKSEYKINVAIRYKEYSGEWTTDAWITLQPGEKKLMGSSDETTYFYYAKTLSKWRKQAWGGKHKFKADDKSLNKVRFRQQDIWECYNAEMCNTFAVFR